ncbi:MAG: beta-ribofuranosylaminobenzene 5'-phosphate synthase [Planctomycetaceae bacterium]|nr:MAG: beta-ribofuranosylaminobenzene 5'-phosphate synthase [Planctomycetaceae bacterium]
MISSVVVSTGARIHAGLLVEPAGQFRSVGWMIDQPGFLLEVQRQPQGDDALACGGWTGRLRELLAQYRQRRSLPAVRVQLRQEIPPHVGLGSGTQLTMAVGAALSQLQCEPLDLCAWAKGCQRARRSNVGMIGFLQGGCVLLDEQASLPENWRFVLLRPRREQGLHGTREQAAFAQMAAMPQTLRSELSRLVQYEMSGALRDRDAWRFGAALQQFNTLVGAYFAPWQGGLFADRRLSALAASGAWGGCGMAQSSWGPSVIIVAADEDHAQTILQQAHRHPISEEYTVQCVRGLNHGATVCLKSTPSPVNGSSSCPQS